MPAYGHELRFGVFITPVAAQAGDVLELAQLADASGLDLVSFQDHPYQTKFLDMWTLLSVVAARTTNVRLAPNVANLPLRLPAVLARSAATLDILSGGRVELGLGAGAFWDGIVKMGGPRRTPGESVDALEAALHTVRRTWVAGPPAPHPIEIWLGAYKPRMLRLTGAQADGWLPSESYLDMARLAEMAKRIDDAAASAGRSPEAVRRLLNLNAPADPARLAELHHEHGFSTFILAVSSPDEVHRFADETAPAVRELAEGGETPPAAAATTHAGAGAHLVEVHDALRAELARLRDLVGQVSAGTTNAQAVRSFINRMAIRQNNWTLGTFCETYCRTVTHHHTLEDRSIFPHLRASDPALEAVIERLEQEHEVIAELLERVDQALVALVGSAGDGIERVTQAMDELAAALLAHFTYEEEQLTGPLDRHGFY
jgi:alkanesulfonate monooxygenase SsuD/methylene tetrahydromethanopterin reductase-like flavin-dependent oxidoreductase (luciferase family)